jgi:two-component system, NtrC family, nitrogen regulation response regulator NtrX
MGQQHRIIVIEDQEDLAALYKKSLTKAGYEVSKAYTGEEGFADFQDRGADAVMLDMTLPEMHGLQTLQKIRELNPNVPVIVITGETSEDTRKQCERLGVHEYLSKPVDYNQLLKVLRRALSDEKTLTEEYEVVTLRLNKRIIECLAGIDENLERAVTSLCEAQMNK